MRILLHHAFITTHSPQRTHHQTLTTTHAPPRTQHLGEEPPEAVAPSPSGMTPFSPSMHTCGAHMRVVTYSHQHRHLNDRHSSPHRPGCGAGTPDSAQISPSPAILTIFPSFDWSTVQRYSRVANSCRYAYTRARAWLMRLSNDRSNDFNFSCLSHHHFRDYVAQRGVVVISFQNNDIALESTIYCYF